MISKDEIRALAGSATYSRGVGIYRADKIFDYFTEDMSDSDNEKEVVHAKVHGSRRKIYDVTLMMNLTDEEVEEFFCTCPAYENYYGMCKHCVAVSLDYIAKRTYQETVERYLQRKEMSLTKLAGIQKGMARQTTPELKQLLEREIVRRALPYTADQTFGRVHIEPYFCAKTNEANVEFRIGITQMYVLKDVFEFEKRITNNEEYSYGKKLKFTHDIAAFDEASRPVAEYICNWVRMYRETYVSDVMYTGSYYYSQPKIRNIPLSETELERFVRAAGRFGFMGSVNDSGDCLWKISDEELVRELTIRGENDGVEVALKAMTGFECAQNYVFFDQGRVYLVEKEHMKEVREFLRCMAKVPSRKAFIGKEDMVSFCRELLPELQKHFSCTLQDFEPSKYVVSAVYRIYLDSPQKGIVTCKTLAVYDDKEYSVYDKTTDFSSRDLVGEARVARLTGSYCNAYDEEKQQMVLSEDDTLLYELLTDGITRLQAVAEVFVSDALKRIQVMGAPRTSIGVSIDGDLLELRVTAEDMPMSQLVELLSKYDRKKKFYRLKNGDFIHMEEDSLDDLLELRETLALTDKQLRQETIQLPKYRALYLDSQIDEDSDIELVRSESFTELIGNMDTIETQEYHVPDSLEATLREYQKQGFMWISTLCQNGFGGILADDMGLGKTLQVIAFLVSKLEDEANRRTLIVSPASLVYNWKNELERFAPNLSVCMVTGNAAERRQMIEQAKEHDILLTSYDLLKRDIESYQNLSFFCEVIDEAQFIKNHNTQAARAVKQIAAGFRLALTGTPVENRLSELWSIFDYLMPGFLYSYKHFREGIEIPIVSENDETVTARLQKLISPFVLRRLKRDVLKDLPDKLEENMYVRLEGEQQQLYDAHVKRMQLMLDKKSDEEFATAKIQILAELTKLRQLCCDPSILFENYKGDSSKTDMCLNLIKNAVENGHKILLFSQFTTMLEHLEQRLDKEKISYYTLTGATAKEKRMELVDAFNADDTSVFCISLKAGGTGLNLTAADIVIHYDPWWNLAVQNQATDRAHRIGQQNTVNVYKLIAKDTIEDNIVRLQEKKMELADKILGGEGMSASKLSKEELMELLQGRETLG